MIIIGDAAHAVSPAAGQGASMAIEDCAVLAKCLRDLTRVLRDKIILPLVFTAQSRGTSEPLTWMFDYHMDWNQPVSAR